MLNTKVAKHVKFKIHITYMNKNTKNIDERVLELFNTVRNRQREIKETEKAHWVTNCTIGKNPDNLSQRINIQTVSDADVLVDLYAFLLQSKGHWDAAANALNVTSTFKWMGFTNEQWLADFKTRMGQIALNKKKKELVTLETRLNGLITPEQRRALELEEIEKSINL